MDNQNNNEINNGHPVLDDNNDPIRDDNNRNNNFHEETSTELMDDNVNFNTREDDNDQFATGSVMGWIGIALSVLSFFMIPILFAGAGIILGIIARMREANTLGYTAIAVGVVSLIVRLFFAPF